MATGLTLDSGALIAADKGTARWRAIWKEEAERGALVTVPAAVLAQVWRGNSPRIALLLQACEIEVLDERAAKKVGALLAKSRTSDVVDAPWSSARLIEVTASSRPTPRISSD
jgi:hypothetical protein